MKNPEYDTRIQGLEDALLSVILLDIPAPYAMPKSAMRKMKDILRKKGHDEGFINNLSDDMVVGCKIAIEIAKSAISDKYDQLAQIDRSDDHQPSKEE